MTYWRDRDFQERLLALLASKRSFLRRTAGLLSLADFELRAGESDQEWGWARQATAKIILDYWNEYQQPIGGMLRTFALDFIREQPKKVSNVRRDELLDLVEKLKAPELAVAQDAMESKIRRFKQRQRMKDAIMKMIELRESGELTAETFAEVSKKALQATDISAAAVSYRETLEERIKRRKDQDRKRYPYLYIDPIDKRIRTFPRGQVGLILAKYKIGKSSFFVHLAQAYALQGLGVVFFTLEDTREMVEDRMDASLCGLKLENLNLKTSTLRRRFEEQMALITGNVRIVDATGGGWSVQRMITTVDAIKNQGFEVDCVLVDYDEQIEPVTHYKNAHDKRFESQDIYIDLVRWAARDQLYLWTAAQATIPNILQMIVSGEDAAEDKSKVRKVGLCLGIGMGPKDIGFDRKNVRYVHVAAHRFGEMGIGWPIVGDFAKATFYDQDATMEAIDNYRSLQNEKKKRKRREEKPSQEDLSELG